MPFTAERLADGLLVEHARAEIGADEPPLLDQPKLLQFPSGQGMKPLHHLPGGKAPVFRLAHAAGGRSARVIHGLDAALCPFAARFRTLARPIAGETAFVIGVATSATSRAISPKLRWRTASTPPKAPTAG